MNSSLPFLISRFRDINKRIFLYIHSFRPQLDCAGVWRHILLSIFDTSFPTQETLPIEIGECSRLQFGSAGRVAPTFNRNNISRSTARPPSSRRLQFSFCRHLRHSSTYLSILLSPRPPLACSFSLALFPTHGLSFTFIYFLNVRPHRLLYI